MKISKVKILKDRIFSKLGYIPRETYVRDMQVQKLAWQQRVKQLEEEKIDRLVMAIKSAHMARVRFINPIGIFKEGDIPTEAQAIREYPPEPRTYKIQIAVDAAQLSRIYQELDMTYNSYAYEYLKRSLLYKIEKDIDALIRVEFGK